jgi:hypothetical protein
VAVDIFLLISANLFMSCCLSQFNFINLRFTLRDLARKKFKAALKIYVEKKKWETAERDHNSIAMWREREKIINRCCGRRGNNQTLTQA